MKKFIIAVFVLVLLAFVWNAAYYQLGIYIVHIGILRLCVRYNLLKCRILEESQKLMVYLRVIHLSKPQHVLYQGTRLDRIVHVHLLKG